MPRVLAFRGLFVIAGAAVMVSCASDPQAAARHYVESGDRYAAREQYKEAIIEYRNAVKSDGRSGDARRKLAAAYAAIGDRENAFREYVRTADLLPTDVKAQLDAVRFLLIAQQYEDAKARAQKVLAMEPANSDAQILIAYATAGLRDLDSAIAEIEEAITLEPDRPGAIYTNLGVLKSARGNDAEAEAAFRRALEVDPKSVSAHLALANFYWSVGRLPDAEQAVKTAIQMQPDSIDANRAMAMFYIASNRAADAESYLKTVVTISGLPSARIALADYYVLTRRSQEALMILQAVTDEKLIAAARTRIAAVRYADGQEDEARRLLDEVLRNEPKNLQALLLKARFLLAEGRGDAALAVVKQAIAMDSRSASAQYVLGLIYLATHDPEGAASAFSEVLKLNPRAVDAQLQLSRLHLAEGKVDPSLQFAGQAIANQPRSGAAHLALAQALMARGDLKNAEIEMNNLLASNPANATVYAEAGKLRILRKDWEGARKLFTRALELDARLREGVAGLVALDVGARDVAAARRRVEVALAASPDDPALLMLAATIYALDRDIASAEVALRKVIEVDPSNVRAYGLLGDLYFRHGRLDAARDEFDRIARRQPKALSAQTMAAVISQIQNKTADAQQRYEKILGADSRAAVAANNLAWLYTGASGNLDVALELARRAKQELPDQPEVNDTLGWVYYRKNLPTLAIPPLQESIAKDSKNPVYHYHLGLAYVRAGDAANARRALEWALKLSATFDGAVEAREVLAGLKG